MDKRTMVYLGLLAFGNIVHTSFSNLDSLHETSTSVNTWDTTIREKLYLCPFRTLDKQMSAQNIESK